MDWRDTLSGIVGSVCCVFVGLPFEVVKLRLQTQTVAAAPASAASAASGAAAAVAAAAPATAATAATAACAAPLPPPPPTPLLQGPLQCLTSIVRGEGVGALWKGASPAVASALLENATVFTANGVFKRLFATMNDREQRRGDDDGGGGGGGGSSGSGSGAAADGAGELKMWQMFASGAGAGVFSCLAMCPAEVVKCRLQYQRGAAYASTSASSTATATATATATGAAAATGAGAAGPALPRYRGAIDCVRQTVRAEGARGLWRGLTALWARDVPFNCVFFGSYELYCSLFARLTAKGPSRRRLPGSGGGGGGGEEEEEEEGEEEEEEGGGKGGKDSLGAGWIFVAGGLAGMTGWGAILPIDTIKSRVQSAQPGAASVGVAEAYRQLVAAEGHAALWRGAAPCVLRAFPANAALFTGVELTMRAIRLMEGGGGEAAGEEQ